MVFDIVHFLTTTVLLENFAVHIFAEGCAAVVMVHVGISELHENQELVAAASRKQVNKCSAADVYTGQFHKS